MWLIPLHCIWLLLCCSWPSLVAFWHCPEQGCDWYLYTVYHEFYVVAGHQWLLGLTLDKDVADTDQYLYTRLQQKWHRLERTGQNTWVLFSFISDIPDLVVLVKDIYITHIHFNFASVFWVCVCVCMRVWLIARDQNDKVVTVKEWLHSSFHLCKVYHLTLLDLIQQPLIISCYVDGWMQAVLWCLGRRWPGLSGWIMNPWSMERTSHSPKKKNLWRLMVQHF